MSSSLQIQPQSRPPLFTRKRNAPFATLAIFLTVWGFFIYGLSEIDFDTSKMSWSKPICPSSRNYWFISVSHYPDCSDLRREAWRLVSMQVVHAGFVHIGGNSIGMLTYGIVAESYFHLKSLGVLIIFQLSVILGALAQNFMYPYQGLVGCSAGVYGMIGLSAALLIMNYEDMDEVVTVVLSFVLIAQIIGDVASYFFIHNSSTGYTAHIFGFSAGLFLGLISYITKESLLRKFLAIVGFGCLLVQVIFFTYSYSKHWPPEVYETSFRSSKEVMSCCLDYFNLIDEGFEPDYVREQYYCNGQQLHPIYR